VTTAFEVQRCLSVPPNLKGNDFVVGDLHGHRSLLEKALDQLSFDPSRDRVLSVGDLIDRGPESIATLSLIEEPWFQAVLGNHELMLLNYLGYYGSQHQSRKSSASGRESWIDTAIAKQPKTVARLADRVAALPLAMHVAGDTPFNVMHGDLHTLGSRQQALLREESIGVHVAEAATSSRVCFCAALKAERLDLVFARHQVQISDSPIGELPITYVGHSPTRHIVVHQSYVYIDQGVRAAVESKNVAATLPTVLDHRRFAYWLHGAASARDAARAALPMRRRPSGPAPQRAPAKA
jgi:serine/threonine protein phosphatase 1